MLLIILTIRVLLSSVTCTHIQSQASQDIISQETMEKKHWSFVCTLETANYY